jgi:uncharacterized membrane protein YbhN (UPF0104 family)
VPRLFALALKIAVTGLLGWYVIHAYLDPEEFVRIIRGVHPAILGAVLLLHLGNRYVLAWQTQACLGGYRVETTAARVFKVQLIASFYSLFLPGELAGGGVTWYLLARNSGQGMMVGGALVYLRLLNFLTLIPFAVFGLLFEPVLRSMGIDGYLYWVAAALAVTMLPFASEGVARRLETAFAPLASRLGPGMLQGFAIRLFEALRASARLRPRILLAVVATSFAGHVLNMSMLWFAGLAAGIQVPFTAYAWLLPAVVLVHMMPVTVGGLGLREISLVFFLERIHGVDPQAALALSAIIFFVTVLFGGLIGGWLALRSGRPARQGQPGPQADCSSRREGSGTS